MIKVEIWCNKCNKTYSQKIEYFSEIDWKCPTCNSSIDTYLRVFDDPDMDTTPIITGRGGCGKQKSW